MISLDEILDAILEAKRQGYTVFGLRADDHEFEIGDRIENSWHECGWADNIIGELNGACCFDCADLEGAIREVAEYANGIAAIYLIAGHSKNAGELARDTEDLEGEMVAAGTIWGLPEGENAICIPNAKVLASFKVKY